MKKFLLVLSVFVLTVRLFAAGNDRYVYIGVADATMTPYDFSAVPYDDVTFKAWVTTRPTEVLDQNSAGAGYEDFDCGVSAVYLNAGSFPTPWSPGDVLYIRFVDNENMMYATCDITLDNSLDYIFVGLDTWFGAGTSTNYPYEPICINTPGYDPNILVYIGVVDYNGDVFDFSASPYDYVTLNAWISGREDAVVSGDWYANSYDNEASLIYFDLLDLYNGEPYYIDEGDTLKISVKQDTDGAGYFTGETFYILEGYYPSETVIRIGLDSLYGEGLGGGPPIPVNVWVEENAISEISIPSEFKLCQNYPNPFNPETEISFSLPKEEQVTLSIFNSEGQLVKELLNGRVTAGNHSINFNASDLNSGIYFYTLETVSTKLSKKMLFIK